MPSATVNQTRDEPRLAPTMSLPAWAQVGCEAPACGAFMNEYSDLSAAGSISRTKDPVAVVLEVVQLGDLDRRPSPPVQSVHGHRQYCAQQRAQPVQPPALPGSRDHGRPQAASRIGAGAGERRFDENHDRVQEGKQCWCECAQSRMLKEEEQTEDEDESTRRLPQQCKSCAVTCADQRSAVVYAAPHSAPCQ